MLRMRHIRDVRRSSAHVVPAGSSVEEGDKIVKTAVDTWGRVDIVVNNAGILRDKSFQKMTDADWWVASAGAPGAGECALTARGAAGTWCSACTCAARTKSRTRRGPSCRSSSTVAS